MLKTTGTDATALRRVAAVMAVVAVTLWIASAIHLASHVSGRSSLYDAGDAGIAEAIIGFVLAGGAAAMVRLPGQARAIGLAAVDFAVIGFLVGLSITARAGHLPDIAYHAVTLPFLIGSLIVLIRSRP